jgi:hypothetical protein
MAGGTFSGWAPYDSYVQAGMADGRYVNAGCTLLAAGPPRLANIGGAAAMSKAFSGTAGAVSTTTAGNQIVYPMGIVQNFNLSQTRQFSRIFEIGSERSYFIGGRTVGQIGLGRVYYHGASLLRLMYAYYQDIIPANGFVSMYANDGVSTMANPHDVIIPPGYENIFINLASDLFTQPVGMLMYVRDINLATMMATYVEACYLPNHTWATDAQGVLVQEQVAIQYERLVPVAVGAVTLIKGADANGKGENNATGANQTFNQTALDGSASTTHG